MNKFFLRLTAILIVVLTIGNYTGLYSASAMANKDNRNIYRLHIVANSNSFYDQMIKYRVRNRIMEIEGQLLSSAEANTALETQKLIMENAKLIQRETESLLLQQNANYTVQLYSGEFYFPDRQYDNEFFPAGKYSALRIVLGAGEGENWWCVMFPPLCIGKYESNTEKPKVKSFFGEVFGEVFGKLKDLFK